MKKKKENDSVTRKMTVYEYEAKYSEKESRKKARGILNTLTFVLAVFLFLCAFFLFKEFYAINRYAGYVAAALLAVLYFVFFILPIVRIRRAEAFETQVNVHSLLAAKRHNAKVRKNLADKITDCYLSVEECEWYSDASVKTLMLARRSGDDGQLKTALNAVYEGDVKRAAREIITKCAMKSGMYSAISQKELTDSLLVTAINLQMVKDLIYLYGFRPSETRLVRIFTKILSNSLVAYGLGGIKVGNSVVKAVGDVAKGIPLLGNAISVLVDSSVQGLGNATLTAVIGRNTVRYLVKEYRLQNVLDGVELEETDEEFDEMCRSVRLSLEKKGNKKTATA
ncbi:MAG: YcjF family protein [Candidatus Borkfalkiaceae bacterium]|nr:YcjF family protein [Christensenellaceae bacterium]